MDHRLLAIEDHRCPEANVTDLLREWGYTVASAFNHTSAVETALAEKTDLIIINHCEPRINAIQICTDLRSRNVRLPVIVLAGRDVSDRVAIFRAGADDYLLKPVDSDELQVRIKALLLRSAHRKKPEISHYD